MEDSQVRKSTIRKPQDRKKKKIDREEQLPNRKIVTSSTYRSYIWLVVGVGTKRNPSSIEQLKTIIIGQINGRAWPGVVPMLPSIYARPGPGRRKPSESLHYLGPYPALEGQGRA